MPASSRGGGVWALSLADMPARCNAGIISDDYTQTTKQLLQLCTECDIIVTSGGVSMVRRGVVPCSPTRALLTTLACTG